MKFETIKTFILTILVCLSLLLTFALWNYQPNYELLYDPETDYVNEVDIGGAESTKKDIIQPDSIIFHNETNSQGFMDPKKRKKFYKSMQEWTLDDFRINDVTGEPKDEYQIEIAFPEELPIEVSRSLFTLQDEDLLPNWSFQRIFITFNQEESSLNVEFLSTDELEEVTYTVKDSSVYDDLWAYVAGHEDLTEYILYENHSTPPIYLPAEPVEMNRQSLTVKNMEPERFVNALFINPSIVSPNVGEAYFTDGQRGMRVLHEGRSMEYINPTHTNTEQLDVIDMLELSMDNINGHKGWTDEYQFAEINPALNKIIYRMYFQEYPVYNYSDLSIIEQEWRDQYLHQYRRSLFKLNNLLGGDTVNLPSGYDVIDYLTDNKNYDEDDITDIQVGYHLTFPNSTSYSITLEPTWFMNYKGNWREIKLEDIEDTKEGGG